MRKIDYFELGGTLYIPATHKNLEAILLNHKYPFYVVSNTATPYATHGRASSEAEASLPSLHDIANPTPSSIPPACQTPEPNGQQSRCRY